MREFHSVFVRNSVTSGVLFAGTSRSRYLDFASGFSVPWLVVFSMAWYKSRYKWKYVSLGDFWKEEKRFFMKKWQRRKLCGAAGRLPSRNLWCHLWRKKKRKIKVLQPCRKVQTNNEHAQKIIRPFKTLQSPPQPAASWKRHANEATVPAP